MCVDGCRAHGAFSLNLMHKLGICRNLLMVLLRAFLIAPHQVQKRNKKRKTLWFCTPLDYFFLSCTGSTRSGKGLCCMDTTESSKGGVQVGLCLCSCRNPWDSLCCLQILRGAHLEASPAFPRFALLLLVPRLRVSSMNIYPLSKGLLLTRAVLSSCLHLHIYEYLNGHHLFHPSVLTLTPDWHQLRRHSACGCIPSLQWATLDWSQDFLQKIRVVFTEHPSSDFLSCKNWFCEVFV